MRRIFDFRFSIFDFARSPGFGRSGADNSKRVVAREAQQPPEGGTPCPQSQIENPKSKILLALLTLLSLPHAHAQWQTQTNLLQPGWNAVYLHVDASYTNLDDLILVGNNPIDKIWQWSPVVASDRFINDPQQPATSDDWSSWDSSTLVDDKLKKLSPNAAYLVHNNSSALYSWALKGKPVPPGYSWNSLGVNFIGFATPSVNPPFFANFLTPVPSLASEGEFYRYDDGLSPFDLTPAKFNGLFNTVRVNRGRAYWVRHMDKFNRYFGAFEAVLQNSSGLHFGDFGGPQIIRLRNLTAVTNTVTLTVLNSETAPNLQPNIIVSVPLLLRGSLNTTNLTFGYTNLSQNAQTVTLTPQGKDGSEAEVVLGVDRASLGGQPGDIFAAILRLTDSLGYSQADLPVSAVKGSTVGLWIGQALVTSVNQDLKYFARASNDVELASVLASLNLVNGVADVTHPGDPITGTPNYVQPNEEVFRAIDNDPDTKYFNIDPAGSGLTLTPAVGATVVTGLTLTSANDKPGRDPAKFTFSGSNDDGTTFTPIATMDVPEFSARLQKLSLSFDNRVSYRTYKLIFNATRGPNDPDDNYFQIAEVELLGVPGTVLPRTYTRETNSNRILVSSADSDKVAYLSTNAVTTSGAVPRPMPLRLIVHHGTDNKTLLLQRVYAGFGVATNSVVATRQSALHPSLLAHARRISAGHLPWSDDDHNQGWEFAGEFSQRQSLTSTIQLLFNDQKSNPFLHTYHPDHDNLDALFATPLAQGVESYGVERRVTLTLGNGALDFDGLTAGANQVSGAYSEEITFKGAGSEQRRIFTGGTFLLNRLSSIPALTRN